MRTFLCLFCAAVIVTSGVIASDLDLRATDTVTVSLAGESLDTMTLELWVRPGRSSEAGFPVYIGSPSNPLNGFGLIRHDGLRSQPGNLGSIAAASVAYCITGNSVQLDSGVWTHVAIVRIDTVWCLYRNGMLVGRGKARPQKPSEVLLLGRQYFGEIDELRLWRGALDAETIRRRCVAPLSGNEAGLRVWLPFDSADAAGGLIHNRAVATGSSRDAHLAAARLGDGDAPLASGPAPDIRLDVFPKTYQLYPRTGDLGFVVARGVVRGQSTPSIKCEVWRDSVRIKQEVVALEYLGDTAEFEFVETIRAEPANYALRLFAEVGREWRYVGEATEILAGDAIIIAGQSNSHPTNPGATFTSPYIRSFGWQTPQTNYERYDPADTLWGPANAHGHGSAFAGPYMVGIWGMELASEMIATTGVPVCIINGGAGGSSIEQNLCRDAQPEDLSTIYGRTLYRTKRAGLQDAVQEIFWHQGESNNISGYEANFTSLRADWHRDYPNLRRIFLFQIRPGCGGEHSALRDLQRRMGRIFDDVFPIATTAIPGHDGCHYLPSGYSTLGHWAYLRWYPFHGVVPDTSQTVWPDVARAWYTGRSRDEIALSFSTGRVGLAPWPNDTMIAGRTHRLEDAFILDSAIAGFVDTGRVSGDTVFLRLKGRSEAKAISYVPSKYYVDTASIYEGPWLTRSDGLGAFTFHRVPIDESLATAPAAQNTIGLLRVVPNPAADGAVIEVMIARAGRLRVEITDAVGRVAAVLCDGRVAAGLTRLPLEAGRLPAGVYHCVATGDNLRMQSGFVLVR